MNTRAVAGILALLAIAFLILNFAVDAGTVFLILAVAAAVGSAVVLARGR